MRIRSGLLAAALPVSAVLLVSACSSGSSTSAASTSASSTAKINVVAAENEYANVASQIGGKYVTTTGIMSNPNTDPHTFEASPSVAREVAGANLTIANGIGYDAFMNTIESAQPSSSRTEIDVQTLLGLPDSTANPHLWYNPTTMPAVANAIATDLSKIQPAHASYFKANAAKFITSLTPWKNAIAAFKKAHPGVAVATTEPVADYMLQAAGADNLTPFGLQADIMNGVDPSPQYVAGQNALFNDHKVKVFVYNQQVTDPLTESFIKLAEKNKIPVIGVYETMPTPGFDYQSWMVAEVNALNKAVTDGVSTVKL